VFFLVLGAAVLIGGRWADVCQSGRGWRVGRRR